MWIEISGGGGFEHPTNITAAIVISMFFITRTKLSFFDYLYNVFIKRQKLLKM